MGTNPMRLESVRNPNSGTYDRLEDPIYVHVPILLFVLTILYDRAITTVFWSHESNPVVLQLGLSRWIGLTAVLILGFGLLWYFSGLAGDRIGRGCCYISIVFHTVGGLLNTLAVLSVI